MLKMHFASTCCANNLHTAKETERGRHLTNMQTLSGKTLLECCVYLCTYSILGSSQLYRPLNHSSDFVLCGLWPLRPRDSRFLWAKFVKTVENCHTKMSKLSRRDCETFSKLSKMINNCQNVGHVSLSLWSNVLKVTGLWGLSLYVCQKWKYP